MCRRCLCGGVIYAIAQSNRCPCYRNHYSELSDGLMTYFLDVGGRRRCAYGGRASVNDLRQKLIRIRYSMYRLTIYFSSHINTKPGNPWDIHSVTMGRRTIE